MITLTPFLLSIITALLSAFLKGRARTLVNLSGSFLLFISAVVLLLEVSEYGRQSVALGGWPLPYAIEFTADGLSAALVLLVAFINLLVMIYQSDWHELPERSGLYPLLHCLIASTIATIMAADLFNLYVWFELMLIATLGLLVLGGKPRHHEAAFKYYSLNMLGTLILLAAIGFLYGATGQLNLEGLGQIAQQNGMNDILPVYLGLLLAALLLKAGAFPLFAWLPASYHTLPAPILALIGGLLTKVTVYIIFRLTGQVFDVSQIHEALGWLAVITMLSGVLGAAYHWDLRRILAFHIISQIGYLLLGVALASQAAATATSVFLFHNMLVKTNLFLIAGLMWLLMGHYDLRRGGGLFRSHPFLAILFLFSAFSLVGVPPTSGFWGKLLLLQEAFNQERFIWAGIALATGLLTLYSMSKIWLEGFWKPHPEQLTLERAPAGAYIAIVSMTIILLIFGFYPEPLIEYLNQHTAGFWGM
jgi:multicomponent Na+:H+ antiporter subunit D